jgi:hypothetical protein
MVRTLVVLLALAVPTAAVAAEDPAYVRANERLAHATPHYPRAQLLGEEPVGGEVGSAPFEAVQRVYFLSRPTTQTGLIRFYAQRLGTSWRRRGSTCLVSGTRVVVAVVHPRTRRLGVLVDSRGASRCGGLTGLVGDLLQVGYPG